MNEESVVYVGVDAAKAQHTVAIAESGRSSEVRYVGEIETTPAAVERFVRKLAQASSAALLLRSRPNRLWALPPACCAWPCL